MKAYLFEPEDVLFFRDGRPIDTAGGHGARWPDGTLIFDALHAALHRAFPDPDAQIWEHKHCTGVSSRRNFQIDNRKQRFGGLATAGIFPVVNGEWFFPAPADWRVSADGQGGCLAPFCPPEGARSNLPRPLTLALGNSVRASKDAPPPWWSRCGWSAYLEGRSPARDDSVSNSAVFVGEWMTGIGIDPATGTQDGERIYSAEYLRLREGVACGFFAAMPVKTNGSSAGEALPHLLDGNRHIVIGGQQRVCTIREIPTLTPSAVLPTGTAISGSRVKWILLTPAIFPAIPANPGRGVPAHPGGWLPTWIHSETGRVMLLDGPGSNKARRSGKNAGKPIPARLVSACIPKPRPLSGWSDRLDAAMEYGDAANRGPRATQLAVPAGAVYYFDAESPEAACKLADALNWHGPDPSSPAILNRRSTLLGEKGLGLGVCGTWAPSVLDAPLSQ